MRGLMKACRACGSDRVGRLNRLYEYLCDEDDEFDHDGIWISLLPADEGESWIRRKVVGGRRIGELGAILCADCGRVDLHVRDIADVPWDDDPDFQRLPPTVICGRCDGRRTGRMGSVGTRGPRVGVVPIEVPWFLFFLPRMVDPVGRVTGIVCLDCGGLWTSVQSPGSLPWGRLEGFARIEERRCAMCDAPELGRLPELGDRYAGIAASKVRWLKKPVGELGGVICSKCGYVEHYLRDAHGMPWESLLDFEWL
jgi:hypothetical protein